MSKLTRVKNFLVTYRHRISALIFFASFIIDITFLPDSSTHEALVIASGYFIASIVVFWFYARAVGNDMERAGSAPRWSQAAKVGLGFLMQFVFGALASILFVFYFRGADVSASLPFLAIMCALLVANEFDHNHISRIELRFAGLLFFGYAFALYLVPLELKQVNDRTFALANVAAIVYAFVLALPLRLIARKLFTESKAAFASILIALFFGFPVLVHFGFVPPLPLVLREARVTHEITHIENSYHVEIEPVMWMRKLNIPFLYPTYHTDSGLLTFYTAVTAPSDISTIVIHEWEKQDKGKLVGYWKMKQTQRLSVQGGRKEGFRTYTTGAVTPGLWRVTARLGTGQILGRRTFYVATGTPALIEEIK